MLKKLVLGFLSLVFITVLTLASFFVALGQMLYPDVYINAMDKADAYSSILESMPDSVPREIITKSVAKRTIDSIITNSLAYVRGDSEELKFTLQLSGEDVRAYFLEQVQKLPICTVGESALSGTCRPEGSNPSQLADLFITQSGIDLSKVDNIDIPTGTMKTGLDEARKWIETYRNVMYSLIAISVLTILAVIYMTRDSTKTMLKWIGSNLLVTGLSLFVVPVLALPILQNQIATLMTYEQASPVKDVMLEIFRPVFSMIGMHGIILSIAGAAMLAYAFFALKEEMPKQVSEKTESKPEQPKKARKGRR